jgi:GT2 family glycosyltransferase
MLSPSGILAVPFNRWDLVEYDSDTQPHLTCSVVIPTRNGHRHLNRTLEALAHSDYPLNLCEVVVVDDHSSPPITLPDQINGLKIRVVVNRPHDVFGAGIARNIGAQQATGDVIIFLDSDIVCDHQLLSIHMRWHHGVPYAAVTGEIIFADSDRLSDAAFTQAARGRNLRAALQEHVFEGQKWRRDHFVRSHYYVSESPDLFRSTVGALLSLRRSVWKAVGGFREIGVRGIEDLEFGYRLFNEGALMVATSSAHTWHQGPRTISQNRSEIMAARRPWMNQLIPVEGFREKISGGQYQVPEITWVRDLIPNSGESLSTDLAPLDLAGTVFIGWLKTGWTAPPKSEEAIVSSMLKEGIGLLHVISPSDRIEVATVVRNRAIGRAELSGFPAGIESQRAAAKLFGERWVLTTEVGISGPT